MVAVIDDDTMDMFSHLVPDDLLEDVYTGVLNGMGVYRAEGNELHPAGALIYRYIELPEELESGPIVDIKWLFVDERYRDAYVADLLLGELFCAICDTKGISVTADIPLIDDYDLYISMFDEWGFKFSTGINREFRLRLSDISGITRFDDYEWASSLSELSPLKRDELIRLFMKKEGAEHIKYYDSLWEDYYDPYISCFTGTETNPKSLLLAHVKPSGTVEIEYYDGEYESIFSTAIRNAYIKCDGDTEIIANIDTGKCEKFLDELVGTQRVTPVIEANIGAPGIDLDAEDVQNILKETPKS